jgi:hypothetical protein
MQISKSFETPEGTVKFEGEISGVELDTVLQLGLLAILTRGLVKTIYAEKEEIKGEYH